MRISKGLPESPQPLFNDVVLHLASALLLVC